MYGKWWREGNIGNWVNTVWRLNQSIFEEELYCGLFYSFKEHSALCCRFHINSHHLHVEGNRGWSGGLLLLAYMSCPYNLLYLVFIHWSSRDLVRKPGYASKTGGDVDEQKRWRWKRWVWGGEIDSVRKEMTADEGPSLTDGYRVESQLQ